MMNSSRVLAALVAGVGILAPMNAALTAPKTNASMITGKVTSQPIGHYEFCRLHWDECSVRNRSTAARRVTPHGWEMVRQINVSVNKQIQPVTDMDASGREEVWSYPTDIGDCEDFVLLKRQMLMSAGFSASDLLITVVRKPDGEGHAVLTLRSTDGDFVLDNLDDEVRPWFDTPYSFLKRQATFDTGRWVTIEDGRDVLVGATQ